LISPLLSEALAFYTAPDFRSACKFGDYRRVLELLEMGADHATKDKVSCSSLLIKCDFVSRREILRSTSLVGKGMEGWYHCCWQLEPISRLKLM
jgi:hypothetical protein